MKMIVVTQCCCGCTVRVGSLIIGVLFAITAVLDFSVEVFMATKTTTEGDEKSLDGFQSKGEAVAGAIFNLLVLAACLSLIFGTLKERIQCIFIWLIVYSVYTVLLFIYIFQICVTAIAHSENHHVLWEIPAVLFFEALSIYSLIVVYSNYRNLKDGVSLPPRTPVVMTV